MRFVEYVLVGAVGAEVYLLYLQQTSLTPLGWSVGTSRGCLLF
jgi:hypothetical protein